MSSHDQPDQTMFDVLINEEAQYSIWPAGRALPLGWNIVGAADSKEACLARIEQLWTDMRPLSLRKQMAEAAH